VLLHISIANFPLARSPRRGGSYFYDRSSQVKARVIDAKNLLICVFSYILDCDNCCAERTTNFR